MNILFPGDHPEIVYPMFEEDYGGPVATHPLQLFVGRIAPDRAVALIQSWHINFQGISPHVIWRWGSHAFAAEFNNRFYAVAVWGKTRSHRLHRLQLHRIAAAPNAPEGTLSALLKLSSAMLVDEQPEVARLISREMLLEETYRSNGWSLRPGRNKTAAPFWEKTVRPPEAPQKPIRLDLPELLPEVAPGQSHDRGPSGKE